MGSTGYSQAESHTGLKWAHVYIRPLTGRKSLGSSWAQIFGEQLTGQIWLRAANGGEQLTGQIWLRAVSQTWPNMTQILHGRLWAESFDGLQMGPNEAGPLRARSGFGPQMGPNIGQTINGPDLASGGKWAQILGEQLTGQIWLRAANGPKYWANS